MTKDYKIGMCIEGNGFTVFSRKRTVKSGNAERLKIITLYINKIENLHNYLTFYS